jgi:hypothetical protein
MNIQPEIRKEPTLSERGKEAAVIGKVMSGVKDVFGDPFDKETNPDVSRRKMTILCSFIVV